MVIIEPNHFFAHFALATNEIAGRVEHRLETQHELVEKARLGVLENLHSLERVQVHVDGDFGAQLVGQQAEYLVVVDRFVVTPQEVEPADDAVLQPFGHTPQRHVRFHTVQFGYTKTQTIKH